MFTSQIIVEFLEIVEIKDNKIKLPKDFRIVPIWYSTKSYIPSYTVNEEEYGGCYDYDDGCLFENEQEKIYDYILKNYDIEAEYIIDIYYESMDSILNTNIFEDRDEFENFITDIIYNFNLSDESINILLNNNDFMTIYKEHNGNDASLKVSSNKNDLKECKNIVDLTSTDNLFIGFEFTDPIILSILKEDI